ncbi:MAG: PQQ-dependent sugar dehydrogenase [Ignavibacteria bacterium]|nr:PQQ-dependent sugar dehydrogenase [Ignavibacteria bacterium]
MRSVPAILIACISLVTVVRAQQRIELSSGTALQVREISSSFIDPHALAIDPEGFIWATDRETGIVWRISPSGVSSSVGSVALPRDPKNQLLRAGLFGIAIDPDFITGSPYVYLSHTALNNKLVITKRSFDGIKLGDPQTLMTIDNVPRRNGHSMLMLADGTLLISVGSFDNSDPTTPGKLTGKLIRMNRDGTAAESNPFYNAAQPQSPNSYVYVYGQRQTAGMTQIGGNHATLAGAMYSVEPGAYSFDEINRIVPGSDYGWHKAAGFCKGENRGTQCPEATFKHTPSSVAFYGSDAIPDWKNSLLVGTIGWDGMVVADLNDDGSVSNIDPTRPSDDVMVTDEDHLIAFSHNSELERIRDIKVTDDGRIVMALITLGESRHGRIVMLENPAVHFPTSVNEERLLAGAFRYGPNPMYDKLNVEIVHPFAGAWTLRLTDMLGNTVATERFDANTSNVSLPTSALSVGAYMITVADGTKSFSAAVVK